MNKTLICIEIISIVILGACISKPKEKPVSIQWTTPSIQAQNILLYTIIDHKTKVTEEDEPPEWVNMYDTYGIQAVENLPEYQNSYVFIAENTGTNFKALQQWTSGFRITHDIARLIAARIQTRLTKNVSNYPDNEYGGFFEAFMKAAFNETYTGAVQETDFWIQKQYFYEDGVTPDPDKKEYSFLILISIDKSILKSQLDALLNNTKADIAPTREQNAAINRIKATFYDGF